jgi:hypothetical protein
MLVTQILGKNACLGYGGEPMAGLAATGRSYELVGITSFNYECTDQAYPGKFVY